MCGNAEWNPNRKECNRLEDENGLLCFKGDLWAHFLNGSSLLYSVGSKFETSQCMHKL